MLRGAADCWVCLDSLSKLMIICSLGDRTSHYCLILHFRVPLNVPVYACSYLLMMKIRWKLYFQSNHLFVSLLQLNFVLNYTKIAEIRNFVMILMWQFGDFAFSFSSELVNKTKILRVWNLWKQFYFQFIFFNPSTQSNPTKEILS